MLDQASNGDNCKCAAQKTEGEKIVKDPENTGDPLVSTQNGEVNLIIQDGWPYEQTQDTLKLIALAEEDISTGNYRDASDVFDEIDELDKRGPVPGADSQGEP